MEFQKIDSSNLWKIVKLQVAKKQEAFVASNTESLLEAYVAITNGRHALPFGIYEQGEPVGFIMLGYDAIDEEDPSVAAGNYCLWRLMIDSRYQGKGLGRKALKKAIAFLNTKPCGPGTSCWLSYESENTTAKALYESEGFLENGEFCDGERVAVRKLDQ